LVIGTRSDLNLPFTGLVDEVHLFNRALSASEVAAIYNADNAGVGPATTKITVNNVAPSNVQLNLTASTINEGSSTTLNGTFTDPGTADTHTVTINWGD